MSLLTALAAASLLAHAGEVHSYMGTITSVEDGTYSLKTTKGERVSFLTAKSTTYRFADNSPASERDLAAGTRVVVEIAKDGKTATSIRISKKAD